MNRGKGRTSEGRYAYPNLDLVIHERASIEHDDLADRASERVAIFGLEAALDLTDGNLTPFCNCWPQKITSQ